MHKTHFTSTIDLNTNALSIELIQENVEEYLHTCSVSRDHLKISLNSNHAKGVDKSDFIKTKMFAQVMVKKKKSKSKPQTGKKMCIVSIWPKTIYYPGYKPYNKTIMQFKPWPKHLWMNSLQIMRRQRALHRMFVIISYNENTNQNQNEAPLHIH